MVEDMFGTHYDKLCAGADKIKATPLSFHSNCALYGCIDRKPEVAGLASSAHTILKNCVPIVVTEFEGHPILQAAAVKRIVDAPKTDIAEIVKQLRNEYKELIQQTDPTTSFTIAVDKSKLTDALNR